LFPARPVLSGDFYPAAAAAAAVESARENAYFIREWLTIKFPENKTIILAGKCGGHSKNATRARARAGEQNLIPGLRAPVCY